MFKLRLVNYFDVWGNQKEGYEVNNLCTEWDDGHAVDLEDRTLLNLLKSSGFLKNTVRINQVDFADYYPFIEIYQRRDGRPLGRLEVLEEGDIDHV